MSNSQQPQSPSSGVGTLVNTRKVQVILEKREGGKLALGPRKKMSGVCVEDFRGLPSGVEFHQG